MLVIISDLHLTDGSSGEIISDTAFRLFRNRLSDMAYDASWRSPVDAADSKYIPIASFDIVLLGDIFDMIRSEEWNKVAERNMPWENLPREDKFFETADKIAEGILSYNKSSFDILKDISERGISIPATMRPATQEEQDEKKIGHVASVDKVNVEVNIYYMVGNHDWFFYIDDTRINAVRNKVIDALGLAHAKDKPFPYYRTDDKAILDTQDSHRVFAEHGDQFDGTNFGGDRNASSRGDAVVIKLLNEISFRMGRHLHNHHSRPDRDEVITFVKSLKEIDNLRPYGLAPEWIVSRANQTKLKPKVVNRALRKTLQEVLKKFMVAGIIASDRALKVKIAAIRCLLYLPFDITLLSKVINPFPVTADKPETYQKYARQLADVNDKDFFVMGHTHYPEIVPLGNYTDGDNIRNKIYINTGTWREVHFRALNKKDFVSYKKMSIASFYKEDERKGRAFEFWMGSLAM